MTFHAFLVPLMTLTSLQAYAADDPPFLARIFDMASKKQKLLFTYKHSSENRPEFRESTNVYKDADGIIAVIETARFVKDGDSEKVSNYHVSQKQLGEEGNVAVAGEKIKFTYVKDGKTKEDEEKLTDNFVVGPSIIFYLQKHWAEIVNGDKVKVRLAVPDRRETIGFEYFKVREETIDGQKTFVLKMKPSSLVISAIVDPLYFFYTPDGKTLVEIHGRTQVKQKVKNSWRNLDAVTTYEYGPNAK